MFFQPGAFSIQTSTEILCKWKNSINNGSLKGVQLCFYGTVLTKACKEGESRTHMFPLQWQYLSLYVLRMSRVLHWASCSSRSWHWNWPFSFSRLVLILSMLFVSLVTLDAHEDSTITILLKPCVLVFVFVFD